ncbi:hypothetical protein [Stutzerimonas kunmingensis]|nr:hypothetical protein [Stutzerimonas kunmingensis]
MRISLILSCAAVILASTSLQAATTDAQAKCQRSWRRRWSSE